MKALVVRYQSGLVFVPMMSYMSYQKPDVVFGEHEHFRFSYEDIDINIDKSLYMWDKYDELVSKRYNALTDTIRHISLVPNFECHGRCTYCYAKESRATKTGYISNELLDAVKQKYNSFKDLRSLIIYGGEPALDTGELKRILDYFSFNDLSPSITTGLLYDDKTYNGLVELMRQYPKMQLTLSIDAWSDNYGRKLDGYSDKELFDLTVTRVVDILNEFGNTRAGLRLTITDDSANFIVLTDLLNERLINKHINMTVEPVTGYELKPETLDIMMKQTFIWNDTEDIELAPARRFVYNPINNPDGYINIMGDCDQMFGGITIDPYGRVHACTETVTHNDDFIITNELKHKRCHPWEKCVMCEFNAICGSLCFAVKPTNTSCNWRVFNLLESIYISFKKLDYDNLIKAINLNNAGINL